MFEIRAYCLEAHISRVPTVRTFRMLVDILANYNYNTFYLRLAENQAGSSANDEWGEIDDRPDSAELVKLDMYCRMQGVKLCVIHDSIETVDGAENFVFAHTLSAKSLAGRVEHMREHVEAVEKLGREKHAKGFVLVDVDDRRHWETFAISLPAIILAANFMTSGPKAAHMDLELELNRVMQAPLGGDLLKLGTLYLRGGALRDDSSELYNILSSPIGYSRHPGLTQYVLDEIGAIAHGISIAAERWIDKSDWAKELVYTAALVDAACHRRDESRLRRLAAEHSAVWRLRSREFGRIASLAEIPRF